MTCPASTEVSNFIKPIISPEGYVYDYHEGFHQQLNSNFPNMAHLSLEVFSVSKKIHGSDLPPLQSES